MKTTTAFNCVWYVCPECGTENTASILNNPALYSGFKCSGCESVWTYIKLCREYFDGTPVPPRDKLFAGALEWHCECGRKNIILPRITKVETVKVDEDLNRHTEHIEDSKFGLCEDCHAEYELENEHAKIISYMFNSEEE